MQKIISNDSEKNLILFLLLFSTLFLWPLPYKVPHTSLTYYVIAYFCFIGFGIGCLIFYRDRQIFKQYKSLSVYTMFIILNLLSFIIFTRDFALRSSPSPLKTTVAFIFFLALINSIQLSDLYVSRIKVFFSVIAIYYSLLIFLHLFILDSVFLTQALTLNIFKIGPMHNRNQTALYLSLMFPVVFAFFAHKKTTMAFFVTAITAFGGFYTLSRSAFLSIALAVIILAVVARERKKYLYLIAIILALYAVLHFGFNITPNKILELKVAGGYKTQPSWVNIQGSRSRYIFQALEGFKQAPVFGNGVGSFFWNNIEYAPDGSVVRYHATSHNDYVLVLNELGIVGFLSFLSVLLCPLIKMWKHRNYIPKKFLWLWEGHFVAIIIIIFQLNLTNFYETMIFWYNVGMAEVLTIYANEIPS